MSGDGGSGVAPRGMTGKAGVSDALLGPEDGPACRLDHDGCVVCSDSGIPVRVITVEGDDAVCEDAAGNRAAIAVELVAPVRAGDVLLTHGGVAIARGDQGALE